MGISLGIRMGFLKARADLLKPWLGCAMQNGHDSSQGPEASSLGSLPTVVLHEHVRDGLSATKLLLFSHTTLLTALSLSQPPLPQLCTQLLPLLQPGSLCQLMATCKQLRADVRSADTLWEQLSTARG